MNIAGLLDHATRRIAAALDLPRNEARIEALVLAGRALGVDRAWLIGHDRDNVTPEQVRVIDGLIARREKAEPVAYILGEREFYGRMFKVTPAVLIPRPETELLVEAALEILPKNSSARILDLGTGSGCIAVTLALERPGCIVTAVDRSPSALVVANDNAVRWGARVNLKLSDWFSGLQGEQFELILGNPPYIATGDIHLHRGDLPSEPIDALESGADGLEAIRQIVSTVKSFLLPGGSLMLEHGWDQSAAVISLLNEVGYMNAQLRFDLAGLPRIAISGEFSS